MYLRRKAKCLERREESKMPAIPLLIIYAIVFYYLWHNNGPWYAIQVLIGTIFIIGAFGGCVAGVSSVIF